MNTGSFWQKEIFNAGYYTVDFESPMELEAGERFQGCCWKLPQKTVLSRLPLNIRRTRKGAADTDGEGYLSYDGIHFQRTETTIGVEMSA